jgi:hypothetical protein
VVHYKRVEMKRANLDYIVRSYGGVSAFARECGVTPGAVYGWLKANSLPPKRAVEMAAVYGVGRDLFYDPWYGSEHGRSEIMTDAETQTQVFDVSKNRRA